MNVPAKSCDLRLLAIEAATLFELTASGRLKRQNSPDRSPAPRVWIAGSRTGTLARVGADVDEHVAIALEALAADEPPTDRHGRFPVRLDAYLRLLSPAMPVTEVRRGLTYVFPETVAYEHDATIVACNTTEGTELLALLDADGMPSELQEMGFMDTSHFWTPWCAALHQRKIVSIAFTARLSPVGAEVGVVTVPRFRGRGLAAATSAAWASSPSLAGRDLFYSTDEGNISSQRVAERLALRFVGQSLTIR